MKKWLSVLVIAILLILAGIYIFIPSQVSISRYIKFRSTAGGSSRFLSQKEKWNAWWPGTMNADSSYVYNGYTFTPTTPLPNTIEIDISNNTDTLPTALNVLQLSRDSVAMTWQTRMNTSSNLIQRFQRYKESQRINTTMKEILDSLRSFMEKNENVYNISVTQVMVTDTLLVTTKNISDHYPTTAEVYQLIGQLQNYISAQGAIASNHPMLYVHSTEDNRIQTMVAIPVNKPLPDAGSIVFKRMVPGKILLTEVQGGLQTVRQAFTQMEYYVEDYKKISPAIPFEMLVTDRMKETDTTKWITRIYYPVL
ncbi:MAG TPA: GyrI-like domain-containing protein [Chitinophagaceae bacterium]